jgi:pyridoxamine 5'-phosphate oxidase
MSLADLRHEYMQRGLRESDLHADPFEQFRLWFEQAVDAEVLEPNAMTLATATPDGRPSARMVLLKGFGPEGFVFFTNYESRKGHELAANPRAALIVHWGALERQVRIEGTVTKTTPMESDTYFHSRPVGSQLGAAVSHQGEVIPGRSVLEERLRELEQRYVDQEVPRPDYWGGYRVTPEVIEFWQGRPNRLHDRLHYRRKEDGSWLVERLSP